MARQLILVKLRAAAGRADALLLDQQFSKVDVGCLEEQVRGAEANLKVADARLEAGVVSEVDPLHECAQHARKKLALVGSSARGYGGPVALRAPRGPMR